MENKGYKIGVIGLGLIGGSLAKSLKNSRFAGEIAGCDSNPSHCEKAVELGIVSRTTSLEEVCGWADIVIVAVPVDKAIDVVGRALNAAGEHTTVIDVGSTKGAVCRAMETHPRKSQFVPTHPMAGTEYSGPQAAIEGLFRDRTIIIVPISGVDPERLSLIEDMYGSLGSKVIRMDAESHDMSVAYVSHISHISSFSLALTVLNKERNSQNITNLAAGGFESTARLAKSNADMWEPIFTQNKDYILDVMDEYIENMTLFKHAIKSGNKEVIRTLINQANAVAKVLDRNKKK